MPVELPTGLEVSQLLMLSVFQVPILNHVLYLNLSLKNKQTKKMLTKPNKKQPSVLHNCKENQQLSGNKKEIRLFRTHVYMSSWFLKVYGSLSLSGKQGLYFMSSANRMGLPSLPAWNKKQETFSYLFVSVGSQSKSSQDFVYQSIFFRFPHPPRIAPFMC